MSKDPPMAIRRPSPPRSLEEFVAGSPPAAPPQLEVLAPVAAAPPQHEVRAPAPVQAAPAVAVDDQAAAVPAPEVGEGAAASEPAAPRLTIAGRGGRERGRPVEPARKIRGIAERRLSDDKGRLTVYVAADVAAKIRRSFLESW